jgi:hypothetical protein
MPNGVESGRARLRVIAAYIASPDVEITVE